MLPEVRQSRPDDMATIEILYPLAFPDENLLPLVRELLGKTTDVFSLIAVADEGVVGHVAFTPCGVCGSDETAMMLAPLAVAPTSQRQGIGSALVQAGLQELNEGGTNLVLVLGDPAYYRRFGFKPDYRVEPPYLLPEEWKEAWQSLKLGDASSDVTGKLVVPEPWQKPELWGP